MAAIPRELIESELFGHEKGAFTGADTKATGRFEQAEGGTLVPRRDRRHAARGPDAAAARVAAGRIHDGRRPHADQDECPHRCRDQQDLRRLIRQGLFREDLFYRLNVVPLRLPPLRERSEDIPELVHHFLNRSVDEGLPRKTIDSKAMARLKRHRWTGNVRELENMVQRLAALYTEDVITEAIVEAELAEPEIDGRTVKSADRRGHQPQRGRRAASGHLFLRPIPMDCRRTGFMTGSCGRSSGR